MATPDEDVARTLDDRQPSGLFAYFVEARPPNADEIARTLWNDTTPIAATTERQTYETATLEQYKLYVEMADRVSARRALANTFFLTLNTAVLTAIGVFWNERPEASSLWLIFPLIALLAECLTWFWTIRSYRQLNSGKWAVVGALETRLPASPYWRAEWAALGKGTNPALYWPLTHVEQWIPLTFAATFVGGFVAVSLA